MSASIGGGAPSALDVGGMLVPWGLLIVDRFEALSRRWEISGDWGTIGGPRSSSLPPWSQLPGRAIIMSVPTQVLIVDDNADFLRASRRLIGRDGLSVVAVASTGEEAIRLARELHPDVVLVDIDLGGESGFDLVRRLHDDPDVQTRTILISTHAEHDFAELVAESPALGFLSKSRLSTEAIRNMLTG